MLAWLNALHMQPKPLASILSLRTGVLLLRLLNRVYEMP